MGLNIFKFLLGKDTTERKIDIKSVSYNLISEIYIRELAYNLMKNKITSAISKCKIMTYEKNKRVKGDEWYRWNIRPNINQNAKSFWAKLIDKLYDNNDTLIVESNGELYVADDFTKNDDKLFLEHTFTNVKVDHMTFNKTFLMSDVFYFELNSKNIKKYLNGTLSLYSGLINAAYSSYLNSNGRKGILNISSFAEQQDDFQEYFEKMINEDFKTFFENPNAVMPLFDGYEYEDVSGKSSQSNTRDIRALIDDIIGLSANALNIPTNIAVGNIEDTTKSIDEFLTFCIDPLIEILVCEMNGKLYSKSQFLNGYFVKFDTKAIKHIDLLDVATSIDKLISSGFTCINDLRELVGLDRIDEDWANQFFMTKNYSTIEDLMKDIMKGGDSDEE